MNYYRKVCAEVEFIAEEDGTITDKEGCNYESKQEAMYYGQLGLCGCGSPDQVHQLLIDCLNSRRDDYEPVIDHEKVTDIVRQHPDIFAQFLLHFLDSKHLTEHGGSVFRSWLTDKGRQFLEIGPIEK